MTLRGEELAYATLDYIREHPEEWDQTDYFCGATACFAGRAILLSGEKKGQQDTRMEQAMRVLEWTEDQAWGVFHCFTSDFDVLEKQVKRVLSGEI